MAQFKNFMAASRKPNLVPFGLMPNGSDLSWIAAYPLLPTPEALTGAQNGVNTTFTASGQFVDIWLFRNGMLLKQGVDYTFNGNSGTVTFLAGAIPETADTVQAVLFSNVGGDSYVPSSSSSAPIVEVPVGTIDGSNATFSLSKTPTALQLYKNGQRLTVATGYTLAGASVIFEADYIPQSGDSIVAVFW